MLFFKLPYIKWSSLSILLLFACSACEYDSDKMNFHQVQELPEEIRIGINLANADPNEVIYIYDHTSFYYEIQPEIGEVERIIYTFNRQSTEIDKESGYLSVEVNDFIAGQIKDLTLDIDIKVNNKSLLSVLGGGYYSLSVTYKIKYINISADDFALKEMDFDKVVFHMVTPKEGNYRLIIDGQEISDPDHIEVPLKNFPLSASLRLYVLPFSGDIQNYEWYKYIDLSYSFPVFEEIPSHSYSEFYYDLSHSYLYVLADRLYVYDKDMHLVSVATYSTDIFNLAVTPATGKVVCKGYGTLTTYSDYTLATVISHIENVSYSDYCVNGKDQLFQINNFQVDVFNLNTGLLLYSFEPGQDMPRAITASTDGEYLYVKTEDMGELYQLTDERATLIYSHSNTFATCKFHPVNKHHIIFSNPMSNFEIFDMDRKETVLSVTGEFQAVDPITGILLYYDENYWENYGNTFLNASYDKVYSWINSNRGFYSDFFLFNDHLMKHIYYFNISHKFVTP